MFLQDVTANVFFLLYTRDYQFRFFLCFLSILHCWLGDVSHKNCATLSPKVLLEQFEEERNPRRNRLIQIYLENG